MGVAVAVLNPQDCLKQPFSREALISPPSQAKSSRHPNRSNRAQPNRKPRRISSGSASPPLLPATVEKPANRLVNGTVKILKRGEDLPDRTASTGLLGPGPEPDLVRPVRAVTAGSDLVDGFYAGSSACIVSPPPSSLPLPAFFAKKVESSTNSEATNALLKILRLDLE